MITNLILASGWIIALVIFCLWMICRKTSRAKFKKDSLMFEAMFDSSYELQVLLDLEGRVLKINKTAIQATEVDEAEVIGKRFTSLHWVSHSEDVRKHARASFQKVLNGECVELESSYLNKSGEERNISLAIRPLKNESGEIAYVLAEGSDITDLKKTSKALKFSSEVWSKTFNAINDIIYVVDKSYKLVQANKKALDVYGENIIGKPCKIGIHDCSGGMDDCIGRNMVSTLEPEIKTVRDSRIGDGWYDVKVYPILDDDNNLEGILHIIVDVTRFKESEQKIKLNEERLESLLSLSHMSDLTKDDVTQKELTDYALEEAVRLTGSDVGYLHFFDNKGGDIEFYAWSKNVPTKCSIPIDSTHRSLDVAGIWADSARFARPVIHNDYDSIAEKKGYPEGHFPIIRHMSVPVLDSGKIVAIIGVANKKTDYDESDIRQLSLFSSNMWAILKRREVEDEKISMERQVLQAHKMEAMGTLAGGIAHDFNNILAAIVGYAELIRASLEKDTLAYNNSLQIMKATDRASGLVRQILDFSRQSEKDFHPINIGVIAKETITLLESSIPKSIKILHRISNHLRPIVANPSQIHQLIMNICTNAVHAMSNKDDGVLSISISNLEVDMTNRPANLDMKSGQYVYLCISDNGDGIPDDIIDKIFDPFFTTKDIGVGSGIGLAMVNSVVKKLKGIIDVKSNSEGTSFQIYLPVSETEKEYVIEESLDEETTKGEGVILLVDDDQIVLDSTEQILIALGYEVFSFIDSSIAFGAFMADPKKYDLLLTDHNMPKMSGLELAEKITEITPDLPIVMFTGYGRDLPEEFTKGTNIREFVAKPPKLAELSKVIKRHIKQ